MKTLNLCMLALFCLISFSACEQDEVSPLRMGDSRPTPDVGGLIPNPGSPTLQPEEFTPLDFSNAKGWNIRWQIPSTESGSFPDRHNDFWDDCAGFLSTSDGTLYSLNDLNNLGLAATAKMDMYLPIGTLKSPSRFPLVHTDHRRVTLFKLTDLTPLKAMKIARQRPEHFEEAFELNPAQPNTAVPTDEDDPVLLYQEGEVYAFKTDTEPPKYGAVIIDDAPAGDVEIIVLVQKSSWKKL